MSQTLSAGITRDRAFELLNEHNKDPFHITHGETVEGTMRYFAREFDPENEEFWGIVGLLHDRGVLIHGDEATCAACADAGLAEGDDYVAATEEDWGREYLALEMSVRVVANEDEAIAHINRYGTMHSEAIIAEDEDACERFLDAVDASAVYANASTRFTDGGEFGLGAEIGISTQKLHARGPFAAEALTTYKYKLRGTGQVRP